MEDDTAESSSTKASIETRKVLRINHLLMDDRKAFDRLPENEGEMRGAYHVREAYWDDRRGTRSDLG